MPPPRVPSAAPVAVFDGSIVRADPEEPAARAIARAVADPSWAVRARTLKQTARVTVLCGQAADAAGFVVVKSMAIDRAKDRLSALSGRTRLMRQWRGAELLRGAGLAAARSIVLFRGRTSGGAVIETLVMRRAGNGVGGGGGDAPVTLLRLLESGGLSARDEHAVARRIGEDLRAMFDAGLTDRDHKPSNMVAERRSGGSWVVVYLDTVGVRRRAGTAARLKTLASMVLEPLGTGCLPRRGVMMRVLRTLHQSTHEARAQARRDWRAVAEIVRTHGDPTPKDDPLG